MLEYMQAHRIKCHDCGEACSSDRERCSECNELTCARGIHDIWPNLLYSCRYRKDESMCRKCGIQRDEDVPEGNSIEGPDNAWTPG